MANKRIRTLDYYGYLDQNTFGGGASVLNIDKEIDAIKDKVNEIIEKLGDSGATLPITITPLP